MMQEPSSFVLRDSCWYHLEGKRLIKKDCDDDKCVTSTTFDPRTQGTTASQGTNGEEGGEEGSQENTATCPYHFSFSCCSMVTDGGGLRVILTRFLVILATMFI